MSGGDWLTDEVITAVAHHMNSDHVDDNVVICRGLGGCDDATAATFVGMTTTVARFSVTGPDGEREIEIEFADEVSERAQVRTEVAGLYHRSAALLGLPPRE
ncbi:MAG TPA: DUF2470 domain-containing protein [Acidimicrobiales bacterium]|nr:DUF2470 domain-containing protein [Acidimicrobiales bacterium]